MTIFPQLTSVYLWRSRKAAPMQRTGFPRHRLAHCARSTAALSPHCCQSLTPYLVLLSPPHPISCRISSFFNACHSSAALTSADGHIRPPARLACRCVIMTLFGLRLRVYFEYNCTAPRRCLQGFNLQGTAHTFSGADAVKRRLADSQ